MGKKENFKNNIKPIFDDFLKSKKEEKLIHFLIQNSSLPGRRANLELAKAFTEVIEELAITDQVLLWKLLLKLTSITIEQAPVNDPKEFLPFCGAWALGSIGALVETKTMESLQLLKILATDQRWRMREGVAKGIARLIKTNSQDTIDELLNWVSKEHWLVMRAVAASVAESTMIENNEFAKKALKLHKKIFDIIKTSNSGNRNADFKVLRKGLSYTLSVVVAAIPNEGFKYMQQLASIKDNDIYWIIKENLKKKRLCKDYPKEVRYILKLIQEK